MKIGNVWVLSLLEDLFFLLISSLLSWYRSAPFFSSSADVTLPFPSAEAQSFSSSFLIPACAVLVFFCRRVVLFSFFSIRVENWIENHSSGVSGQPFPHKPECVSSSALVPVVRHLLEKGLLYDLLGVRFPLGRGTLDLFSVSSCLVWTVLCWQEV